ncbi:enoyl-CoA hydratase-related protein [Rhodobacteraceae bacterium D3-12]|nr:enoyl-CoA hydratase-related protein [Rhodobacteraceae bacterium D3-12]
MGKGEQPYSVDDGVAVVTLPLTSGGAENRFEVGERLALEQALCLAAADDGVLAVVIAGAEERFAGRLLDQEVAHGKAEPDLAQVCQAIEQSEKPVVAALRGSVADAGFEIALAAHARVAAVGTMLSLGDVRRGLIPGAGATQRLPRLIGAGTAIDLMLTGRAIAANSGALRGLFRKVVARNVVGEAVQAARAMVDEPAPEGPAPGFADPMAYQDEIAKRRRDLGVLPAEAKALVDCVEAAQLLPIEAGLAMEGALRAELRGSARAQGLTHTVAQEQRQPAPGGRPEVVTILGDGALAFGLVQTILGSGAEVRVAEQREGGAARLIERVTAAFGHEAERGRIDAAMANERLERLSGGPSPGVLSAARLVIEASEAPGAKLPALMAHVSGKTGEDVPLVFTAGMGLGAGVLRENLGGRAMGLALHAAVQGAGLAELVIAPDTVGALQERARNLLRRMGRQVVLTSAENGLIVGALKAAMFAAAEWCVAQGAQPDDIDRAMGWACGPFRQADAEGLGRQAPRFAALGMGEQFGGLFAAFMAQGREGRATGRGVLRYAQHGAAGDFDAAAQGIVQAWRGGLSNGGAARDGLSQDAIRRRIWSALFCAGLELVERGVACDAGDVDLAALVALGLPRASGGPMKAGELRGLLVVRRELERWQGDAPALWYPSERLNELIKNGGRFGVW